MDFSFTAEQERIRDAVTRLCAPFDAAYWLARDRDGGFPEDFHKAFADAGIEVPEGVRDRMYRGAAAIGDTLVTPSKPEETPSTPAAGD